MFKLIQIGFIPKQSELLLVICIMVVKRVIKRYNITVFILCSKKVKKVWKSHLVLFKCPYLCIVYIHSKQLKKKTTKQTV